MSILITGSLAIDRIMVFQDRFKNHILPEKLHILSISFHVPTLDEFQGGCAGNIAHGVKLLGGDPLIVAAAGRDFGPYAQSLDARGIRRDGIAVFEDAYTAQCFITTDLDDNQIVAFHPGAMERASGIDVERFLPGVSVALVGPDDNQAMRRHAATLKARGVPLVCDPGQQLINFDGPGLLEFLAGARVYVVNDYEWAVTLDRTGLGEQALAARAGAIVVTRGAEGSTILEGGARTDVPAVKAAQVVDPTGCGDAFRAGLLVGLERGLPLETAARLGSVMGTLAVEQRGTQSVSADLATIRARYAGAFGPAPL
ncbi:MAG: carbohydrate kinase family protein [Deltaproteobacteria bacterium]|nr:carbohydrate kinase family protein [Deltaproteobacteria bacterium]